MTNTDTLKKLPVARVGDDEQISTANDKWHRIDELNAIEGNADAEFLKTWLRAQHAETIREAEGRRPQDFDIIGTAFHKWVRDNDERPVCSTTQLQDFLGRDFDVLTPVHVVAAGLPRTHAELTAVFTNACNRVTPAVPLPIMAAIGVGDDDDEFRAKAQLVATYLDPHGRPQNGQLPQQRLLHAAQHRVPWPRTFGATTPKASATSRRSRGRRRTPSQACRTWG